MSVKIVLQRVYVPALTEQLLNIMEAKLLKSIQSKKDGDID